MSFYNSNNIKTNVKVSIYRNMLSEKAASMDGSLPLQKKRE